MVTTRPIDANELDLTVDRSEFANRANPLAKEVVLIPRQPNGFAERGGRKPEEGFARAHYEQHVAGQGTVCVGDEQWSISGLGLRDHSWGPRYWQNIHWYRWLPMSFSEEFAMMISIIAMADGRRKVGGMVLEDGEYHSIEEANLSVDYDENRCQTGITATVKTGSKSYHVEGHVLSLIPLRNRRTTTDGRRLVTRITEGMTRYTCDGRVGFGMSEFLDQIVDGKPVGP